MQQVPQITVEDYAALDAGAVVLLDVREPEEWEDGHAPEAVHVPMNSVPSTVAHDPDRIPTDTRIVVTCKAGGRSAQVTAWLNQQGFDAVNLEGGMLAWATAHRAMVSETGEPPSVR